MKKSKAELTEFELESLELIKTKLAGEELSLEDQKKLNEFFEEATANGSLNKKLGKLIASGAYDSDDQKEMKDAVETVHKYTYKSTMLNKAELAEEKLKKLLNRYENGIQIGEEMRLSLKDIGVINKVSDLNEVVENYMHLDSASEKLKRVAKIITECQASVSKLDDYLNKETTYAHGDIIVDVAKDVRKLHLRKAHLEDKIQDKITKYEHAAIGFGKDLAENLNRVSEIYNDYRKQEVDGTALLASQGFRVTPYNLLKPEAKKILKEALSLNDDNLSNLLNTTYQTISQQLHGNKAKLEEAGIENSYKKRKKAGLADFKVGGHKSKQSVREWAGSEEFKGNILANQGEIADIIKSSKDSSIICSGFAAKMTVLTLVALEERLAASKTVREAGITELFEMPFKRHENLDLIHPERLIKQLQKHNAVVALEKSVIAQTILQSTSAKSRKQRDKSESSRGR